MLKGLSGTLGLADKEIIFFRKGHFVRPMVYLMKKVGIQ
jgi:hypothetical protein